ncbi:MAG: hypothetical protein WCV91_06095 [Candidatus Margulisiibacteriota bacterium]
MGIHELKADFERIRSEVLVKISRINEKWKMVFQKAQGNTDVERDLLHLKLELQIVETRALKEFERIEEKIKKAA